MLDNRRGGLGKVRDHTPGCVGVKEIDDRTDFAEYTLEEPDGFMVPDGLGRGIDGEDDCSGPRQLEFSESRLRFPLLAIFVPRLVLYRLGVWGIAPILFGTAVAFGSRRIHSYYNRIPVTLFLTDWGASVCGFGVG